MSFDFTAEYLYHACALSCNPSSTYQMLIRGGRESGDHWKELKQDKLYCVRGCRIAADKLSEGSQAALPSTKLHENILGSSEKKKIIVQARDTLAEMKTLAGSDCVKSCSKETNQTACLKEVFLIFHLWANVSSHAYRHSVQTGTKIFSKC
mmetsp:Transcript_3404/g.4932  ORF Transcript_3404/g.4932 Transcript_3404/m.4932 type:complete len:151 (-) Transcript_3404:218-670(-)